jgi:general secretion pathway protein B
MSFILDALRKSEQERQRNQGPRIADVRVQATRSNKSFWLPLVMLLVGINFSLLLFLWLKASPDNVSDTGAEPVGDSRPTEMSGYTPPPPAMSRAPETALVIDPESRLLATELPAEAAASGPEAGSDAEQTAAPANRPQPAAAASAQDAYSGLPAYESLVLAGIISLEPLHLDIHVYSDKPAERFVFINKSKYREGETLKEGPLLDAITAEGVVLRHQGNDFILTRE